MDTHHLTPTVFVSRCLGFEACRWNGVMIPNTFVEKLSGHVKFIHTCPEKEVGLGVPRTPVRIVIQDDGEHMVQLETAKDVTEEMDGFSSDFFNSHKGFDGFIFKDRSPSCGMKDVKAYTDIENSNVLQRTTGLFAAAALTKYPDLPAETDGRLRNFTIREHFLTRLFSQAAFTRISSEPEMKELVRFHTEHKFLLMAYNQNNMRKLGKIAANHDNNTVDQVFSDYRAILIDTFKQPPHYTSNINVLMHGLGYVSDELSAEEKRFFLNTLEEYRREQVPLSVPLKLLKSHVVRFQEPYLMKQTFFEPFPPELVEISDSGKGRNY